MPTWLHCTSITRPDIPASVQHYFDDLQPLLPLSAPGDPVHTFGTDDDALQPSAATVIVHTLRSSEDAQLLGAIDDVILSLESPILGFQQVCCHSGAACTGHDTPCSGRMCQCLPSVLVHDCFLYLIY